MKRAFLLCILAIFPAAAMTPQSGYAQASGGLRGTVLLEERELAVHQAAVLIVQLGRSVRTAEDGTFVFTDVPPGVYDIMASSAGLASGLESVTVLAGQTASTNLWLRIAPVRQDVTVTATGVQQRTFEAFHSVDAFDSFQLAEQGATALGNVLDATPGIAQRSNGPGPSRPVIRGFDGDRVLVLQDGARTGSLASQSSDHGEPIDVLQLERLEVVKGPATLLYGSNAIGGVVNAVSGYFEMRESAQDGLRGYFTGLGGSTNGHAGGGAGFEYGAGNWLIWGSGGNQRTSDYRSPIEIVGNTGTRITTGTAGVGWFGNRGFLSLGYQYTDGGYGIPEVELHHDEEHDHEEEHEGEEEPGPGEEDEHEEHHEHGLADIDYFRRRASLAAGIVNRGAVIEQIRFAWTYNGWVHREIESPEDAAPFVGTAFDNKEYGFRVAFDQRRTGLLSGTFGVSGLFRDYFVEGIEALTPPVDQRAIAVFGLEEVQFDGLKLQFGGRIENTRYNPDGLPGRSFTGFSGSTGVWVPLWTNGALVTNFTRSYRAPALEELYNNGPHIGNLTFEIGDPDLIRERSNGLDVSLRHLAGNLRFDANFYVYGLDGFVFLAPTGEEHEDLIEAVYSQGRSRFTGTEITLDFPVHPALWINSSFDYVDARLTDSDTPLPRIPPVRGRLGLDFRHGGLSIKPRVTLAGAQDRIFPTETATAGYALFDLAAAYTLPQQHFAHHFAVNVFNAGNRLYSNHVSISKDRVPEIGRGVRFAYSMKFF